MNKMMFEDAYLLGASVKDDVKKVGEKWIPTGTKKLELALFVDVKDGILSTGKIKYVTSVKEPCFNVNTLLTKLKRFEKLTVNAFVYEYGDRTDYRFYQVIDSSKVDLTSASSSPLEPVSDDTYIPF